MKRIVLGLAGLIYSVIVFSQEPGNSIISRIDKSKLQIRPIAGIIQLLEGDIIIRG